LTTLIIQNTKHNRKNIHFKILNITTCKAFTKGLLDVEQAVLIKYYYQTAKAKALYESTDGPAGQPADKPPNSYGLGDFHRTVPELTVPV
jgi:hypothetical protein